MKWFVAILITLNFVSANAQGPQPHGYSAKQLESMALHNLATAQEERTSNVTRASGSVLPFAEYQTTGFVVFSDDDYYGMAANMKATIAKNLPAGTTLMVYTDSTSKSYHTQLFNKYSQYIAPERLKILQVPDSGSNNFWSRDNLPLPVWNNSQFSLVDARYYYNFEPDAFFQSLFNVSMTNHNYFYEGGNFIANSLGNCIVVNRKRSYPGGVSDTAAIPDTVFSSLYGCKTLTRLKHLKGIGHADEVVKFMSDDVIITDTPEYATQLKNAGYQVIMLPEPELDYETYINSLQVNDTIFVPTFGEDGDQTAIDAYKKFGLKVVPIPTRELATGGQGGIHCITMNYPPSAIQSVMTQMGAIIVK